MQADACVVVADTVQPANRFQAICGIWYAQSAFGNARSDNIAHGFDLFGNIQLYLATAHNDVTPVGQHDLVQNIGNGRYQAACLLYTSDAADDL